MGERGPAPTPTPILKIRGSKRASGRGDEVSYSSKAPTCPAWLNREAKAEWKRQVKQLQAAGVLSEADRAALATYCEAWGEFTAACQAIEAMLKAAPATGLVEAIAAGLVNLKNKAAERLLRVAGQFGFTPAARSRVSSQHKPEAKPGGVGRFFTTGS